MLIGLTLFILGVLTIFSMVLGSDLSGSLVDTSMGGDLIVNGSATTLEFTGDDMLFAIDPTVATIAVFVIIIAIVAVLGIQVLGSGLSPESIKVIMACILYGTVWGLLSVLAMPLILAIEVFGTIIYMVLLIGYIVGVIQAIVGGEVA
ncbi:MAG: hypothetical protein E3J52_09615 [Promethearchaeota archaeon]|nr:MAG: hypothetical protein E3J52_09615 [Candidatus Lokiarchaeota archaeon]